MGSERQFQPPATTNLASFVCRSCGTLRRFFALSEINTAKNVACLTDRNDVYGCVRLDEPMFPPRSSDEGDRFSARPPAFCRVKFPRASPRRGVYTVDRLETYRTA